MPRLKSAIKRVKTNERNRLRNLVYKSQIKTLMKKVLNFVSKKDVKSAQLSANEAFALIDRSSARHILHLNNAAHKKSRISKWLKTLEPTTANSKS